MIQLLFLRGESGCCVESGMKGDGLGAAAGVGAREDGGLAHDAGGGDVERGEHLQSVLGQSPQGSLGDRMCE